MSEGTMEFHVDSDKEVEGDDSEAENSEEELKRIEEDLYFAIHYGEAGNTGGEETANVTVYQDSPVKVWNATPSPHPKALSTPKDGPTKLETSDHKPKVAQTNDLSPKTNEPLNTPKRKKQLKSAANSGASPVAPAVSVSSALDSQSSNHASKLQPEQGRDQEQKTQSTCAPAPIESCRLVTGQPETGDHVNVARPGMSISVLLKALQVSKHSAWSEDSDSSLDSGPVSHKLRPKTETAGTDSTPLKMTAKSSPMSDSTGRSKNSVTSKVCEAVKVYLNPSPQGEKTESPGGAQSSHSSTRESAKNVVDYEDAGDNDQLGAGLSKMKETGKSAKKKKTSMVRTTRRDESSESDTLQKGKVKSSPTLEQPPASKSRELQEKNVKPVQSPGSSSSSGEESDSESSSSDESDSRVKKMHKTKKMSKPSSSTLTTKQKEKSITAGRTSKVRKQAPKSKGSDAGESAPAESPVKMDSSSSDSESEPEKPKKTKIVSKVPKKVISCKTDSDSDNSGSKEKKSKKAQKKVQSAFSTVPKTKGQSKQTLESLHPDVSVTIGSDSSMEESDTTTSSEDSDASSKSLDVNDSDFLNQLSDSSLKEDIMYNMTAEDNNFVNQANNSQTVLSTPEPSKWHLNARDQAAAAGVRNSGSRSMRYFLPTRCDNCQEPGHLARDCPKPRKQVCHLCGRLGHTGHQCPERQCYNCDYPGHDARDCPRPRRSRHMICRRCQMGGHKQEECPDQWRQYHATTSGVVPVKVKEKRNKNISCYNCGARGHLGYECRESRMNGYTMPSYPYVSWYDSAESINRTIKAAKATKGNEEDNPWRPIRAQDPAGSKRKHEDDYDRDSKRRKTSRDSSPQRSNRDDLRKEKAAESEKKPGSGKDSEKAESRKRTETGRGSKQGDSSSRDVPEAEKKRQNEDVTLTNKSKKSAFSGPLEDFIPLGGGKKDEWRPTNHGGANRSGFNARPHTGHMARVRRWSESGDEEPDPLLSTVRNILGENRKMLREVTGDVTTHHLTGRPGQRPQGVLGNEWQDSQRERQPVPPRLSRKRRREQESQIYGHHSSQWGEVDNAFHLIGADIGQLVKDTQDSHSVHGSPWDKLQDDKHTKNFHNAKHSNMHRNIWDLPSSSKRGRYDFPRTSQNFQADLDAEPSPRLNRKAQQRAIERAAKESKKTLKEQRKLQKLQKRQQQEQQQRELEDEFGEDYDHQVFNNEWWLKDDASPPSPLPGGKKSKKKGKKKKKKSGNQQDSFEDDEGEDPFLTGIIQRQRKKGRKKSFLPDTRRKSPNFGVGSKTFKRNSPGPSHSGRRVFQKPSPHHHKQNQKHHNQKHEHHGHNQEHHKQNQGRHVSWNSSQRSPGFKKGQGGSSHFSHRVNSSFSPEPFPRNHSKGPQASFRGRGQGHRGFVSWGGFRVKKDILDRASNFFQNKGGRKNW